MAGMPPPPPHFGPRPFPFDIPLFGPLHWPNPFRPPPEAPPPPPASSGTTAPPNSPASSCNGLTECFPAGTLVTMKDGRMPIEHLKCGAKILQKDLRSNKPMVATVQSISITESIEVCRITTSSGKKITTTPGHPFWLPQLQVWAASQQLQTGDVLLTDYIEEPDVIANPNRKWKANDLHPVTMEIDSATCAPSKARVGFGQDETELVVAKEFVLLDTPIKLYTISTTGNHTYFADGVCVHNMCTLMGGLLAFLAGAAAGLVVGYVAEDWARQHLENEVAIQMISHTSAFGGGAAAGALVGTFVCPGLGTAAGALIGGIGGVVTNGCRMIFYPQPKGRPLSGTSPPAPLNPDDCERDESGNIKMVGYLCGDASNTKDETFWLPFTMSSRFEAVTGLRASFEDLVLPTLFWTGVLGPVGGAAAAALGFGRKRKLADVGESDGTGTHPSEPDIKRRRKNLADGALMATEHGVCHVFAAVCCDAMCCLSEPDIKRRRQNLADGALMATEHGVCLVFDAMC